MKYYETEVYLRNPLKEDTRIITQKLYKFDVEFRITGKICSVSLICNFAIVIFRESVFVMRNIAVLIFGMLL